MLTHARSILALPELLIRPIAIQGEEWNLFFYKEFESLFYYQGQLRPEVKVMLEEHAGLNLADYRLQVDIGSVPLLLARKRSLRELRFYTPRMNQELFLLQELRVDDLQGELTRSYDVLKAHTEACTSMPGKEFPTSFELVTEQKKLWNPLKVEVSDKVKLHNQEILQGLLTELNNYKAPLFEKFSDVGLGMTANYALLRVHLLKFLAILPSLDHDKVGVEVKRLLIEALRRLVADSDYAAFMGKTGQDKALPSFLHWGVKIALSILKLVPAAPLAAWVRASVKTMARRFIAGESIDKAEAGLQGLKSTQRDATLDLLGELVVSEKEADHYCNEVIKIIRGLKQHFTPGTKNAAGLLHAHVSIKVSALCSDFRPEDFNHSFRLCAPRLIKILQAAKEEKVFINVDAEHYHFRDLVFKIYQKVLLENAEFKDYKDTGIVIQAYVRDAYDHLMEILELAKKRGHTMPVRLVKGAYWDAETVEADAHGYVAPQFLNKEETDLHYRQLTRVIFENYPHLQLCLAGHNFADHSFAVALKNVEFPTLPVIEHQCLHMTYEALSTAMARMGWVVRNYVPVGSLLVGMAYLVRRIMENSSQVGVLTIMRSHKRKTGLKSPEAQHLEKKKKGLIARDRTQSYLTHDFFNMPPVRTYRTNHLETFKREFEAFKNSPEMGIKYSSAHARSGAWLEVNSNSDLSLKVGSIQFAAVTDVGPAMDQAYRAYAQGLWSRTPWLQRAGIILGAARLMMAKRNELSALIMYESGKSIKEALGDVDEAIDFLQFYCRQEAELASHGSNKYSRGVMAVISPWNFPLAIPCGMVSSCLLAGNSVLFKSAEQTPLIAEAMTQLFYQAGIPTEVLIHLPGEGETIGEAITTDERLAGVVFTGSKQVGLHLIKKLSNRLVTNPLTGQRYPAKVITEMGGKNAIIVTANAELDETVSGILASAFGHSGQKCSACSRVLVHRSVKESLVNRLTEAVKDLKVGRADDFSSYLNPIVSVEDQARLRRQAIEAGREAAQFGGRVLVDRSAESLPGTCVGPVLIELPKEQARKPESYARKELFGPILHVISFDELSEAIELFNCTEYGLTGGVFSQGQDDIDYLVSKLECGNLYINRSITGARVGIEPFGGFKLSGTGPKAGGREYMTSLHVQPVNLPALDVLQRTTPDDEQGEFFSYELARPSGLSWAGRYQRFDRGLDLVVHNFEYLFQGIYSENKKLLMEFRRWLRAEGAEFCQRDDNNVTIPGQLSFDRHNLIQERLLLVAHEERAHFATLFYVMAALLQGVGVTVACRNEQAFHFWTTFNRYFITQGLSKENFNVWFSSQEHLDKVLLFNNLDMILVDADLDRVLKYKNYLVEHDHFATQIKAFLSPHDAPAIPQFRSYLVTFVKVRSFAINTMRHGAPLELSN
jgi:RHH-type proline utilization regulon transcriptional repressor/proline dehydrogenase/delta 1-pyrroline-5-carboxylate dehydrogenase